MWPNLRLREGWRSNQTKKKIMPHWLNLLSISSLVLAAASSFGGPTDTNSTPTPLERDIDIGGRTLHLATYGHGSPAVIVESGMGEAAVGNADWKAVITAVAKTTTICVYDRAGIGKSSSFTNDFRTIDDVVEDLHSMLGNAKIPPPYILVGHSLGGLTMRLYAGRYPEEVAGVVLVDSSHPEQGAKLIAALAPESSSESKSVKELRSYFKALTASPTNNSEHLDLVASAREASAITNLGSTPLVVLSHSAQWRMDPSLPKDVTDKMQQMWQELQNDLCGLSTQSSHVTALKAGHHIHREEPQLVIDAILKVEATAKNKAR